jgi:hypothetical protein
MSLERTTQGIAADAGAAVSGTGAAFTWIAQVNDVLQLIATLVAIVAGVYALRWHKLRIQLAKEKMNVESNRKSTGGASRSTGDDTTQRD